MNGYHLTKLSLAALLYTVPTVFAQVHTPVTEPAPAPVVAESAFLGIEYWRISTDYKDVDDKGAINRVELAFNYAFK
jgi:hypothetical protein